MKVLIVADDLTGALDSAVVFAHRGMTCGVVRSASAFARCDLSGFDVIAVSTESRDGSADAARVAVETVADVMVGRWPECVFKKVDSRLKGHVGIETDVLRQAAQRQRMVIAPAIPDMGRVTAAGHVTGMGVAEPIAIAPLFGRGESLVADIRSDADFDALLAECKASSDIYVGARGLAAALARRLMPQASTARRECLAAPALFAIGSRDPITEAQVERLIKISNVSVHAAPNGVFPASEVINASLTLVKMTAGERSVGAADAGRMFAEGAAHLVRENNPATLLACGGETANAILEQLNIDLLHVRFEILPGVAVAEAVICGKMTSIVTKSGGFGEVDVLVDLASALESFESEAMATESGS